MGLHNSYLVAANNFTLFGINERLGFLESVVLFKLEILLLINSLSLFPEVDFFIPTYLSFENLENSSI